MNIRVGSIVRVKDDGTWAYEFRNRVVKPRIEFVISSAQPLRLEDQPRTRYICTVPESLHYLMSAGPFMFLDSEVELVRATCPMEVHDGH